jgi:hypothetical protein
MVGGNIATRNKKKYQRSKKVRVDRKRMKRKNKVGWKNLEAYNE